MKFTVLQLNQQLTHKLLPIYLLEGNEPFLMLEAKDIIRSVAKQSGYIERQSHEVTKDFNWQHFFSSANELSLFGNKSLVELCLNTLPSTTISPSLSHYLENCHEKIVLVNCDKLTSTTMKSSWIQTIEKIGAIVSIRPLNTKQFLEWIQFKLRENKLLCEPKAIQFIADATEGNLLACAQEIEKLTLLFPDGTIKFEDVINCITNQAHYGLFNFVDIVLEGNPKRIIRALQQLQTEDTEPTLILWALTRQIRDLIAIAHQVNQGTNWTEICKKHRLWDARIQIIKSAIKKTTPEKLQQLLLHAEKIDHMIKGIQVGNFWDEIMLLTLKLSSNNYLIDDNLSAKIYS